MTTIPQDFAKLTINPRRSNETERRHLLADSVAPSESASMIYHPSYPPSIADEDPGTRTPGASSPAPRRMTLADPTPIPQPYKGFPSEAHYLAALREWADGQNYVQYDKGLTGFYGHTTMAEYASRPGPNLSMGIKDKWRARKARKFKESQEQASRPEEGRGRRATVS